MNLGNTPNRDCGGSNASSRVGNLVTGIYGSKRNECWCELSPKVYFLVIQISHGLFAFDRNYWIYKWTNLFGWLKQQRGDNYLYYSLSLTKVCVGQDSCVQTKWIGRENFPLKIPASRKGSQIPGWLDIIKELQIYLLEQRSGLGTKCIFDYIWLCQELIFLNFARSVPLHFWFARRVCIPMHFDFARSIPLHLDFACSLK